MMDYDYNEHAKRFMEESKRLRQEHDAKEKRRMLWLGKFAFPKVNTKKTRLLFVPPDYHRYYLPVMEPLTFSVDNPAWHKTRAVEISLDKWGYNGKRWRAIIRFGYYEKDDVLLVCKEAFIYQQRHRVSDGSDFWF